jgi:hypothetical protein
VRGAECPVLRLDQDHRIRLVERPVERESAGSYDLRAVSTSPCPRPPGQRKVRPGPLETPLPRLVQCAGLRRLAAPS